jgi:hypothetical protein
VGERGGGCLWEGRGGGGVSSVGIVRTQWVDDREIGIKFPTGRRNSFFSYQLPDGLYGHPSFLSGGTGRCLRWTKLSGRETDHLPLHSIEVKKEVISASAFLPTSHHGVGVLKRRANFTCTLTGRI